MKHFIGILAAVSFSAMAQAPFEKKSMNVYCGNPAEFGRFLAETYDEKPTQIFMDSGSGKQWVLTENRETKTWTLILVPDNTKDFVCAIAAGDGQKFLDTK